jgi:hypothetical protein
MNNEEVVPIIHLYSPQFPRTEGYLAGNIGGLQALRDAIDRALEGEQAIAEVFHGDGEEYNVCVTACTENQIEKLVLPYTDKRLKDTRKDVVWPRGLFAE